MKRNIVLVRGLVSLFAVAALAEEQIRYNVIPSRISPIVSKKDNSLGRWTACKSGILIAMI